MSVYVKLFGRRPHLGRATGTGAGVRKAAGDETALPCALKAAIGLVSGHWAIQPVCAPGTAAKPSACVRAANAWPEGRGWLDCRRAVLVWMFQRKTTGASVAENGKGPQ